MRTRSMRLAFAGLLIVPLLQAVAHAQTASVTVKATDVIYAAGTQAAVAKAAGGTIPAGVINLPLGATAVYIPNVTGSLACPFSSGCITLNSGNGYNLNNPDGSAAQVAVSSVSGSGSISGITAPGAGYLVGVFIAPGGPSGSAPRMLNFTKGLGTARTMGAPLLDQVFFIGDGLTGDGTGMRQVAKIPTGATQLVLGISDACGYEGSPNCYSDNIGSYLVTYAFLPTGL